MNQFEFSFGDSPWETAISALKENDTMPASYFLTLMEPESEETVEEAFDRLLERNISLDIAELPALEGTGEAALRLRREAQLVKEDKLLTALDEHDPLRLYLSEIAELKTGNSQNLAQQYLFGDMNAMSALADAMLPRVAELAKGYVGKGVLLLDLIQEGSLGLLQAIQQYKGGDFEAMCCDMIHRVLVKTVVMQARAAGIGQKMRQALEDYRAVDERLLSELGRNPTVEEIAEQMHMTPGEITSVVETMDALRLLDRADSRNDSEPSHEDDQAVEDTAYFQMRQRIQELLSGLTPEDAQLLNLRFGLEGGMPLTPEETGRKLGLTPEEVVKREAAALQTLRING